MRRKGLRWKGADLVAGPGGWSPWVYPRHTGYKMACCDCSLVHTVDFRIDTSGPLRTREGGRVSRAKGHVKMRVARDNRSTAMLRRYKEPTHGKTFLHFAADSLIDLYAEHPEMLAQFLSNFRKSVAIKRRQKARAP